MHGLYSTDESVRMWVRITGRMVLYSPWVHQDTPTPCMGCFWVHPGICMGTVSPSKSNTLHVLYSISPIKCANHGHTAIELKIQHHAWAPQGAESIKIQDHAWAMQYWVQQGSNNGLIQHLSPPESNTMHGLYSTESNHSILCMENTVLSPSKCNTMHGLYSTESIKMQHHAWAIQYWVHQNATPCMGYTVPSPSKSNTMHGLYSTESIKIQHHAWAIQYRVHQNATPCMG